MVYEKYPRIVTIAVTDRCNLSCWICQREYYESLINGPGQFISIENLYKLEKPIRNAEVVSLTGFGETFMIPNLEQILEYIISLNPRDNLINTITNGTLLSEKWGRLLKDHLHSLVISFNAGTEETYNKYVRKSGFDSLLIRIHDFMSALGEEDRNKITFTSVVHKANIHEMTQVVEQVNRLGGTRVGFNQYQVNKDTEENVKHSIYFYQEYYNAALASAIEQGAQLGMSVWGQRFGQGAGAGNPQFNPEDCTSPFNEVIINADGRVVPCCYAGHYMGNAYEMDFDAIWFGEEYEKLRLSRYLDACKKCQPFVSFDDYNAHVAPDLNRRKPEEIKQLFEKVGKQILHQRVKEGVLQQLPGIDLYEVKRGQFGPDYSLLLERWKQTGSIEDRRNLDRCYESRVWMDSLDRVNETHIALGSSFSGSGWGFAECNPNGPDWRWIGPEGKSNLFILLKVDRNYTIETQIHTALGESLWSICAEINGNPVLEQGIHREGNLFFHRCQLPVDWVRANEGRVKLTYRIDQSGGSLLDNQVAFYKTTVIGKEC